MVAQVSYSTDSSIELELTSTTAGQITITGSSFDEFKIYGR